MEMSHKYAKYSMSHEQVTPDPCLLLHDTWSGSSFCDVSFFRRSKGTISMHCIQFPRGTVWTNKRNYFSIGSHNKTRSLILNPTFEIQNMLVLVPSRPTNFHWYMFLTPFSYFYHMSTAARAQSLAKDCISSRGLLVWEAQCAILEDFAQIIFFHFFGCIPRILSRHNFDID